MTGLVVTTTRAAVYAVFVAVVVAGIGSVR